MKVIISSITQHLFEKQFEEFEKLSDYTNYRFCLSKFVNLTINLFVEKTLHKL